MSDVAKRGEIVSTKRVYRNIPEKHRVSDDSRIQWLWNQRFEVVQTIFSFTDNVRDRMAATLVLSATLSAHLPAIELVLRRLEGGAVPDQVVQEEEALPI